MGKSQSIWKNFDIWLLTAVIVLTAYGVLIIRSAITDVPAYVGYETRQIQWAVMGLVAMFGLASIDYRIFTVSHWYIYGGIVGLLVVVLLFGTDQNGVTGWLNLGVTTVQPAEFVRIFLPITIGQFLAKRQEHMNNFINTLMTVAYIGLPIGLLFLQPDLGMSILFLVIWFGMLVIAGLPIRHFFLLMVMGAIFAVIMYPNLEPYQRLRIATFLESDPTSQDFFNIDQALTSIGSGGWWGKGYMNGTQSQLGYLRVQHTDFIFAVIMEEMGVIFGALVVLSLIGFILLRIIQTASMTTDPAGKFICIGIAVLILFQTIVSVGMNLNLMPVTGLTLPFVSYGGSALLSLYMGIGIVQSVRMRYRRQSFG